MVLNKDNNHSKLKGRIREKNESYRSIAKKLSISATTLSNKINGHTVFNADEIRKLVKILDIPDNEIAKYFFNYLLRFAKFGKVITKFPDDLQIYQRKKEAY